MDVITAFAQLQSDRHRADYDMGWKLLGTDVANALALAETTFSKWRAVRDDDVARDHLLSMFGAKR